MPAPPKNNFNPKGRPKGVLNQKTIEFISMKECFISAFFELQKDPKVNVVEWGKKNPTAFYSLASKLFPIEIQQQINITNMPMNKWIDNPNNDIEDARIE